MDEHPKFGISFVKNVNRALFALIFDVWLEACTNLEAWKRGGEHDKRHIINNGSPDKFVYEYFVEVVSFDF